jgi:peptidyl-tRNA hydrolase, PTH1 family
MAIFVGLGNPGNEYAHTRHNVGWFVVDALADELDVTFRLQKKWQAEVAQFGTGGWLVKPQTYMNGSGESLKAMQGWVSELQGKSLPNLYVVHDDLDLETGKFKLQFGTGPKVHNGLHSIYQHLGTEQFWHCRVGVDGRSGVRVQSGKDYVLSGFTTPERPILEETLKTITQALLQRT